MARTVLLRHSLPDGSVHWDWLFQRPDATAKDLLPTFRLEHPFNETLGETEASIRAQPIGDHRPYYLDYEGEVSGNRGQVRRVWEGRVVALEEAPDSIVCVTSCGCGVTSIEATPDPTELGWWVIRTVHKRR